MSDTPQKSLSEMSTERSLLVAKKQDLQAKLSAIKNLVRSSGLMPREKYRQCCDSQTDYLQQVATVEKRLAKLNNDRTQALAVQYQQKSTEEKKPRNWDNPTTITELCTLRQEYQEFAADGTRISSKRQMASEFVIKLNGIIKRAINKEQ